MEEIKEEIQLEKLKEAVLEKKPVEVPKEKKEVAYKDDGGFGGILASKLAGLSEEEDDSDGEEEGTDS